MYFYFGGANVFFLTKINPSKIAVCYMLLRTVITPKCPDPASYACFKQRRL